MRCYLVNKHEKEKNFVSAVVYLYNNEREVGGFLKTVNDLLKENFEKYGIDVIGDDFTYITDNNLLRHDNIKLGFHIFYYLMKK